MGELSLSNLPERPSHKKIESGAAISPEQTFFGSRLNAAFENADRSFSKQSPVWQKLPEATESGNLGLYTDSERFSIDTLAKDVGGIDELSYKVCRQAASSGIPNIHFPDPATMRGQLSPEQRAGVTKKVCTSIKQTVAGAAVASVSGHLFGELGTKAALREGFELVGSHGFVAALLSGALMSIGFEVHKDYKKHLLRQRMSFVTEEMNNEPDSLKASALVNEAESIIQEARRYNFTDAQTLPLVYACRAARMRLEISLHKKKHEATGDADKMLFLLNKSRDVRIDIPVSEKNKTQTLLNEIRTRHSRMGRGMSLKKLAESIMFGALCGTIASAIGTGILEAAAPAIQHAFDTVAHQAGLFIEHLTAQGAHEMSEQGLDKTAHAWLKQVTQKIISLLPFHQSAVSAAAAPARQTEAPEAPGIN